MEIKRKKIGSFFNPYGVRIAILDKKEEAAHAYVYYGLHNDLHEKPFAFLEDVFVEEKFRKRGYGVIIVRIAINEARKKGCYKMILTFRHSKEWLGYFYQQFGFESQGNEMRLNLK